VESGVATLGSVWLIPHWPHKWAFCIDPSLPLGLSLQVQNVSPAKVSAGFVCWICLASKSPTKIYLALE